MEQAVRRLTDCKVDSVVTFVQKMQQVHSDVKQQLARASQQMATYANKHRREVDIAVGDMVWIRTSNLRLPKGLTRKLVAKFMGPYPVTK